MATTDMVVAGETGLGRRAAGTLAMAQMGDEEFEQRLACLKKGQERIRRIKRELMEEGTHYGTIPGTDKPTLLKPGAEVLCSNYGLVPDFVPKVEYGDGILSPPIRVTMRCELHHGDTLGPIVAVGFGEANSWERKHKYRRGERTCPDCGVVGSVRRSTFPNKGGAFQGEKGWWCKDCRTNWDNPREPNIVEQQTGDVINPDQHDLGNTLLKMSKKRAFIDAALTGTASSDLFTQDLDEQDHQPEQAKDRPAAAPQPAPRDGSSHTRPVADAEGYPSDPEAYERHGVEPPAQKAAVEAIPPCPQGHSGERVMLSRLPKNGKYYCRSCSAPYGHKVRA